MQHDLAHVANLQVWCWRIYQKWKGLQSFVYIPNVNTTQQLYHVLFLTFYQSTSRIANKYYCKRLSSSQPDFAKKPRHNMQEQTHKKIHKICKMKKVL